MPRHQHAAPGGGDALEGHLQLGPAVTAQRAQHVAGEAFGMEPHQHVLLACHIAAHQHRVLGAVGQLAIGMQHELPVAGGQARGGHVLDALQRGGARFGGRVGLCVRTLGRVHNKSTKVN